MKKVIIAIVFIVLIAIIVVFALLLAGQFDDDSAPTPTPALTPTPTPPSGALTLGESGIIPEECYLEDCKGNNNIQFTIIKYESSDCLCGGNCSDADDWWTRVLVYYKAENLGTTPTNVPYLSLFYEGEQLFLWEVYDCENYPYPVSYLEPGASNEGWKYNSEVPKSADISQIRVGVKHPDPSGNIMKPYWILGPLPTPTPTP